VINPAAELADDDLDRLLAEERADHPQLGINGTFADLLDAELLFAAVAAQRATAVLLATRYPGADDDILVAEIGARQMDRRLTADLALLKTDAVELATEPLQQFSMGAQWK
jgi:hypothetical protein